jgi:hypothetical protein
VYDIFNNTKDSSKGSQKSLLVAAAVVDLVATTAYPISLLDSPEVSFPLDA